MNRTPTSEPTVKASGYRLPEEHPLRPNEVLLHAAQYVALTYQRRQSVYRWQWKSKAYRVAYWLLRSKLASLQSDVLPVGLKPSHSDVKGE